MYAVLDIRDETRRLITRHAIRTGKSVGDVADTALNFWLNAHPLPPRQDDAPRNYLIAGDDHADS